VAARASRRSTADIHQVDGDRVFSLTNTLQAIIESSGYVSTNFS